MSLRHVHCNATLCSIDKKELHDFHLSRRYKSCVTPKQVLRPWATGARKKNFRHFQFALWGQYEISLKTHLIWNTNSNGDKYLRVYCRTLPYTALRYSICLTGTVPPSDILVRHGLTAHFSFSRFPSVIKPRALIFSCFVQIGSHFYMYKGMRHVAQFHKQLLQKHGRALFIVSCMPPSQQTYKFASTCLPHWNGKTLPNVCHILNESKE